MYMSSKKPKEDLQSINNGWFLHLVHECVFILRCVGIF